MIQKISRAVMACLAVSTFTLAAEPALITSYDMIGDRVRKQNPDLAAARLRIREATGRLNQSGRLSNPELSIEAEHNNRFNEGAFTVRFSQRFPVTDRLRLEKEVSAIDVQRATAEVAEKERELTAEARQAIVEYLALGQRRRLLKSQIELTNELSTSIKQLADKGEASALDASQARLEALQIKTELRQLDALEKALNGVIKPLLGMALEKPLMIGGSLEKMPVPTVSPILDRRGDVRATKYAIDGAAKQVELEQARRYADIEAGVFASIERSEDAPEGFETEGIIGVGFTIPLPLWDKNEGNIEEAKARVQRKQLELTALQKNILHQAKAAREEMQEWAGLLNEIDTTVVAEAVEQADLARKSYNEGLTDIQTVLRTREQKLRLQNSRIDALEQFHKARARHESALGL